MCLKSRIESKFVSFLTLIYLRESHYETCWYDIPQVKIVCILRWDLLTEYNNKSMEGNSLSKAVLFLDLSKRWCNLITSHTKISSTVVVLVGGQLYILKVWNLYGVYKSRTSLVDKERKNFTFQIQLGVITVI